MAGFGVLANSQPALGCPYDVAITQEAQRQQVNPAVAVLLVHAESSGNPLASGDHGRARGLFQLTEATWKRVSDKPWSAAWESQANLEAGIRWLSLNKRYGEQDGRNYLSWHNGGIRQYRQLKRKWREGHPNRRYAAAYTWGIR